ncbi:type I-E CRISPR-associated protein Cas6/Cse3/CasE [Candidatus Venteria ishoeyi]|uniref:CRISPR system Cascade subunit CasE n=1 Tax=Candidatus Venteria ishoeyi TaxID=1899563 RepID=A0A1H6F8Y6_9GAMM|nr:type I-E CRISPR-associated protein Cas6/Cse3/CasE [Candidatus Venteria ishoeyi]SEH05474.1 CRISPR system Cascade subunit CasE [Candidatus Venteria ishoeyi]
MYLSKVQLRSDVSRKKLHQLSKHNIYAEHQLIWQLFQRQKKRDFLYRRDEQQSWPLFYVLSSQPPQDNTQCWQIHSKSFVPQLQEGVTLYFSLRANPVVVRQQSRNDIVMDLKKRLGKEHVHDREIQETAYQWLQRQGEKHGFNPAAACYADAYQQHRVYKPGRKSTIRYSTLDFNGQLQITQPENFIAMLKQGIGRSKSFGCGLMLIRRI